MSLTRVWDAFSECLFTLIVVPLASSPVGELSRRRVVPSASCPVWSASCPVGKLSRRRVVLSARCPIGELSRRRVVRRRDVRTPKFFIWATMKRSFRPLNLITSNVVKAKIDLIIRSALQYKCLNFGSVKSCWDACLRFLSRKSSYVGCHDPNNKYRLSHRFTRIIAPN
jgi:hypothetical protein